jgi:phage shock protein E
MKTFLAASIWQKRILFSLIGAMGGYAYYYFIGCSSGACPISSNPWISTLYGAGFGFILALGKRTKESMATVADKIKAGAKIVDVRTPMEFADGHFPNAVNIPVDQVQRRIHEFGDKQKPIVVHCASGSRSAHAARILTSEGYTDVTNAGGLRDMPE